MKASKIKLITDAVKSPCLVGITAFEEDVQQFTCNRFNGENCECHRNYKIALRDKQNECNFCKEPTTELFIYPPEKINTGSICCKNCYNELINR